MFRRRPPAASPPSAPTTPGDPAEPIDPTDPLMLAERAGAVAAPARIGDVRVRDGVVTVVLDVAGLAPDIRDGSARAVVAALVATPGVRDVRVVQTAPRDAGAQPAAGAGQPPAPPPSAAPHPLVIMIGSGKGGVGKSTVSTNIAVALHRRGMRVGLVDADIHGPSQHRLAGTGAQRPQATGGKMIPVAGAGGVPVLSTGMLAEPGQAIAWRGAMVGKALDQLIDAHWDAHGGGHGSGPDSDAAVPDPRPQVLIIDMPPGTGDIQLSMIQRHRPAGAIIVSTPQDLSLIDATRAADLFVRANVPIIGMVENMAGYTCPHCGEASDPFGQGGVEAAAAAAGLPFLGRIPLTPALRIASDAGTPPALTDDAVAAPFHALAATLADWLAAHPVAPPPRPAPQRTPPAP